MKQCIGLQPGPSNLRCKPAFRQHFSILMHCATLARMAHTHRSANSINVWRLTCLCQQTTQTLHESWLQCKHEAIVAVQSACASLAHAQIRLGWKQIDLGDAIGGFLQLQASIELTMSTMSGTHAGQLTPFCHGRLEAAGRCARELYCIYGCCRIESQRVRIYR